VAYLTENCGYTRVHAKSSDTCIVIKHICGVMVRVLVSSAVDHGFVSRSGQTKDDKIGI